MIPTHSPSAAKAFCRAAARMELGVARLTSEVGAEVDAYAQATYAAAADARAAASKARRLAARAAALACDVTFRVRVAALA